MPVSRPQRQLLAVLLVIGLVRLVSLGTPALIDSTEGRYGATALQMLASGDWVTPQIPLEQDFEPYLGKPPLHFWAMAASLGVFGADEWAARLPSFLAALAMVWTTVAFAAHRFGAITGWLSGLILATSALYFLLGGAVNVDVTLAACVNLAVVACCRVAEPQPRQQRLWGLLFFASLGLGFLTKGPIAIALTGLVGIAHLLVYRDKRVVTGLPWLLGPLLFLAITAPWFVVAEQRNPGFLRYFFVNENLLRFTETDYGDRYGSGREHPLGSSWLFLLAGTLPWNVVPLVVLCTARYRSAAKAALRSDNSFLLLWAVAPAALFTLAPQFTPNYLLPGFGAFAIFTARLCERLAADAQGLGLRLLRRIAAVCLLLAPVAVIVGVVRLEAGTPRSLLALLLALLACVWLVPRLRAATEASPLLALGALAITATYMVALVVSGPSASSNRSTGAIFERFTAARPTGCYQLGLVFGRPFSAYFYGLATTGARIRCTHIDPSLLADDPIADLLVRTDDIADLPTAASANFRIAEQVGSWAWLTRK